MLVLPFGRSETQFVWTAQRGRYRNDDGVVIQEFIAHAGAVGRSLAVAMLPPLQPLPRVQILLRRSIHLERHVRAKGNRVSFLFQRGCASEFERRRMLRPFFNRQWTFERRRPRDRKPIKVADHRFAGDLSS